MDYLLVRELYHHGIKGQSWGERNGPPYPLNYEDHTAKQKKLNPKSTIDGEPSTQNKEKKRMSTSTKKKIAIGVGVAATVALAAGTAWYFGKKKGYKAGASSAKDTYMKEIEDLKSEHNKNLIKSVGESYRSGVEQGYSKRNSELLTQRKAAVAKAQQTRAKNKAELAAKGLAKVKGTAPVANITTISTLMNSVTVSK